ncbi:STAS domain-containing protein [Actinoplanes sp. Pm04-4]|uniref:STAS domain-containing protein n=1 Tax=Paractinoplanes pyxinae TaxID=2997416 RepID=A0ABT4AYZ4_9ACTN|nr:STAS domain-containing protein [Actinoplanes pyxinae]MCY1139472.1 STAS domain-containing protein [Actinoplanes pyxinae]
MESRPSATTSQPGVFALSGSLDAGALSRVSAVLGAAQAYASARRQNEIVIDLEAARFIEARVIRLLLQAQQTALESGRRLRVVGATGTVRHALVAAGTGRLLTEREGGSVRERGSRAAMRLGGEDEDWRRASAERRRAEDDQARLRRRLQQQAVDGEVRATRRDLLTRLRHRLRTEPRALTGLDFLAVADRPAVVSGILTAATIAGGADACDLQLYDRGATMLRSAGRRGLPSGFRASADVIGREQLAERAVGRPVVVPDITRSPIFAGQPGLDLMRAAGLFALRCYFLRDDTGRLLGVLSMYYRRGATQPGEADLVARDAGQALAHLPEPD